MKPQRLNVKRRSVRKGAFRKLFANVARKNKRHRAATTSSADFESDVPNLGVARALVVILVIHVVAIAGIFVHSRWIDNGEETVKADAPAAEKKPVLAVGRQIEEETNLPKLNDNDSLYNVGTGDTYENIAGRFEVTEDQLRLANENIPLRPGRVLRIPAKTVVAIEPPELTALRQGNRRPPVEEVVRPAAPVERTEPVDEGPPMVTTDAARRLDSGNDGAAASSSAAGSSKTTYKVSSGDTFWAIARKHGTTVEAVMSANNIDDPRKLRPGMDLVIPN